MNLQKIKVYHLFWITSLIILLIGIVQNSNPNAVLDINIHDTYFVIRNIDNAVLLFTWYFLIGLAYWLVQKKLKKELTKYLTSIHITILIGSFIFYCIAAILSDLQRKDITYKYFDDGDIIRIIITSEWLILVFISTPLCILNLLTACFRKNKTKKLKV